MDSGLISARFNINCLINTAEEHYWIGNEDLRKVTSLVRRRWMQAGHKWTKLRIRKTQLLSWKTFSQETRGTFEEQRSRKERFSCPERWVCHVFIKLPYFSQNSLWKKSWDLPFFSLTHIHTNTHTPAKPKMSSSAVLWFIQRCRMMKSLCHTAVLWAIAI